MGTVVFLDGRPVLETDVLVVGAGPAGASAALLLATYGVDVVMITRYGKVADTPRAHYTNQRTVEIFRDLGIEDAVIKDSVSAEAASHVTLATSLAGDELGRIPVKYFEPRRASDYFTASPCLMTEAPQDILEPILVEEGQLRGAKVRFDTEYVGHEQHEEGVVVRLHDRLTGTDHDVRARYLVGADGARSKVAADLDLPFEGPGPLAGSLDILIEADLSRWTAHRPSILYAMLQPGIEGKGLNVRALRMIKPWSEWILMWGYDLNEGPPDLTEEFVREVAVQLVGSEDFEMRIKSISPWTVNHRHATTLAKGRVFCVGDAVHQHPPTGGLGSNTSIQDSYNLAWKLAHVLRGTASSTLLESYDAERAPIARQVVERANKSAADNMALIRAFDLTDTSDPAAVAEHLAARKEPGPRGERIRRALHEAMTIKSFEFLGHGVEFNQRYSSCAIVPDGSPPEEFKRDPEMYAQHTTRPGAKLPHAWVTHREQKVSTLDLGGRGEFSIYTGIGGAEWLKAAESLSAKRRVTLRPVVIGPGQEYEDPFFTWTEIKEISESGVLLIRPDLYVAYRHAAAPSSAEEAHRLLAAALDSVLGQQP